MIADLNILRNTIVVVLILWIVQPAYSQEPTVVVFSGAVVKKKITDKICDTCNVDYGLNAEPEFSYLITGAGHTAQRFSKLKASIAKSRVRQSYQSSLHIISQRTIGITFLPNAVQEKGRVTQRYRNFGGETYDKLEFLSSKNGKVLQSWTPLFALEENRDFAILGTKEVAGNTDAVSWKQHRYAGSFDLDILDSVNITVRNIATKKIVQAITVVRAKDPVTNFIYYQVPITSKRFSTTLQHLLNMGSEMPEFYRGDASDVFQKDYNAIGLLRFFNSGKNEEIQYSFGSDPYLWQSIKPQDPQNNFFMVLGNDMEAGKDHHLYLRYASQPETVHKITVKVKAPPFVFPWAYIAAASIFLLVIGWILLYVRNRRNRMKLAMLQRKSEDTETRLDLLSGQLNPHFLFNTLNAIQGTIHSNDPEKSNAYIANVAKFMRSIMDNGKKEFISLQEELELEQDYLNLEQERKKFTYSVIVAADVAPSIVDFPPLLLQPVLENCIRHGFGKEFSDPTITMEVFRTDKHLVVRVADNGNVPWKSGEQPDGYGLSLIRKRMAVYNEKMEGISIKMELSYHQGNGTIAIFTFENWLT